MKNDTDANKSSVNVGNISGVSGDLNIAGRDISTTKYTSGLSAAEIERLFNQLYSTINDRPETSSAAKEDLKAEVEEIQSTLTAAAREEAALDEGFLSRRFRNIARIAPDVLDVVVATLVNPLAGLGVAARKIAERAKAEAASQ